MRGLGAGHRRWPGPTVRHLAPAAPADSLLYPYYDPASERLDPLSPRAVGQSTWGAIVTTVVPLAPSLGSIEIPIVGEARQRARSDPVHSIVMPSRAGGSCQTSDWSSPWTRMSRGRSRPMNTILLSRVSPAAQGGPRSLPMSWCTPWKMTLRSVPCMSSTPL